ncbi:winged helix-turn-helix domain-containing protein [Loktanella sp. D2R18]|uniref:winged helix-turn-helix domain-containing protein n=1 Tax=Rhodobacterales TaxID=204455 RepID=UPI000DE93280|nr:MULTISPECIES: crosslink repair DNA glycosylase YcaQ family protein [Rhodobacterales]MDO6590773.1 crosslink repair DNA glycosylase YcaQ family protein [Yoonia sp. 1_MG-2023]RBW43214.1 winged helix-turn-helix domain-containing protein [Loktanella sp. D2R18]
MNVPVLSNIQARHVFLRKHGLSSRPSGAGKGTDLAAVIDDLGFVQLDSVNTFARAHDLILWSRRQQYRPTGLQNLLHRDRAVFEHWTHDAAAIPIASFPYWRMRFARDEARLADRWKDWRRDDFMSKTQDVMNRISDDGPCTSGQVGNDESRGSGGWWDWHPSKTALEFLWRSGQLSVLRRDGFTKVYDLTERVIPEAYRAPRPDIHDTIEWCCAGAMDRLGFATSGELAAFWDNVTPAEAKTWCADALADGRIIEIDVAGADGKLRRSFAWPDVMDQITAPSPRLRILSPFDPALRDRKRAERLFGFHYRIEIFVPAAKRKYGYYVFPVIQGDQMIGRIDMKRDKDVLHVKTFWPEAGVRMGTGRVRALTRKLERAATFGGCDGVSYVDGWL